jgi:hypothetical protein
VRTEWVLTLGDWLLKLPERIDHEPRLLPFLLSALTDDVEIPAAQHHQQKQQAAAGQSNPVLSVVNGDLRPVTSIASIAADILSQLGAQHESEHAKEIDEVRFALCV